MYPFLAIYYRNTLLMEMNAITCDAHHGDDWWEIIWANGATKGYGMRNTSELTSVHVQAHYYTLKWIFSP